MTPRKFYRTVFQVEVLSEDAPTDYMDDLEEIQHSIVEGDCSGSVKCLGHEELNGEQAAAALLKQRSDPDFFRIDREGNDVK